MNVRPDGSRTSTEEQAERFGLSSQVSELRALAERRGYTVPDGGEFLDDGWSGSTLERPALRRLREAVRTGGFAAVLVHDPDRLSRRLAHQLLLSEEFERAGVQVEFVTVEREDSPEGRLLLNVRGVIAEYERERIKERVGRGLREKARRGLIPGGATPYGYRRDPGNPGRLVVDDTAAATVRMIYGWLVREQRTMRAIALELRRLGIGAPRAALVLLDGADDPHQRGLRGPRVLRPRPLARAPEGPGPGPPEGGRHRRPAPRGADCLCGRAAAARAESERGGGTPRDSGHLVRGLLRCAACGRRYRASRSHPRPVYRCAGRDPLISEPRCRAPVRNAGKVDALVWQIVVDVLRRPDVLGTKLEAHRQQLGALEIEARSEVVHLTRELETVDRQAQKLLDLYLGDGASLPGVRRRLEEVAARKQALQGRLARAQEQAGAHEAAETRRKAVRRFLPRPRFAGLPVSHQRAASVSCGRSWTKS